MGVLNRLFGRQPTFLSSITTTLIGVVVVFMGLPFLSLSHGSNQIVFGVLPVLLGLSIIGRGLLQYRDFNRLLSEREKRGYG